MFRSFYVAVLVAMAAAAIFSPTSVVAKDPSTLVLVQFSKNLDDVLDDVKKGFSGSLSSSKLRGALEVVITRENNITVPLKKEVGDSVSEKDIIKLLETEYVSLGSVPSVSNDLKVASERLQPGHNLVIYIVPCHPAIRGDVHLPTNLVAADTQIVVIQLVDPEKGVHACRAYEMVWSWRKAGSVYMMIPGTALGQVLRNLVR